MLKEATSENSWSKVLKLLNSNVNLNVNVEVDKNRNTPLHLAAWYGHKGIAELLASKILNTEVVIVGTEVVIVG